MAQKFAYAHEKAAKEERRRASQLELGSSRHTRTPPASEHQEDAQRGGEPDKSEYYFFCGNLAHPETLASAFSDVFDVPPSVQTGVIYSYAMTTVELPSGARIDVVVDDVKQQVAGCAVLIENEPQQRAALRKHSGYRARVAPCRIAITEDQEVTRRVTGYTIKSY